MYFYPPVSVESIGVGRASMQKQTSIDGLKLNIMPKTLLTSPDKATIAEQFCASGILPSESAKVNPYAGKLEPVSDANLSGNGWYLFADPAEAEAIVYGHLEGQEGPRVETRNGFSSDGVEMKVALDFAASVIDYRGAYKNKGA